MLIHNRTTKPFDHSVGSLSPWAAICCALLFVALYFVPAQKALAQGIEVVEGEPVSVLGKDESQQDNRLKAPSRIPVPSTGGNGNAANNHANTSVSSSVELFVRLQELQDEVRELRGLLEQQGYLIEQLGQRRMDDYLDLDRRIGELKQESSAAAQASEAVGAGLTSQGSAVGAIHRSNSTAKVNDAKNKPLSSSESGPKRYQKNKVVDKVAVVSKPAKALTVNDTDEARQAYRAAYQKIKAGDFDVAQVELLGFIDQFPNGADVPVALFWLGELQLQDSSIEKSLGSYGRLVEDYPQHRKVPAAKFKLGKIHQQRGDTAKAKRYLQSVVNDHSGSSVAKMAREYLSTLK